MHANYPNIEIQSGQDEINATMVEHGQTSQGMAPKVEKKKYDLKLVIGRDNLINQVTG